MRIELSKAAVPGAPGGSDPTRRDLLQKLGLATAATTAASAALAAGPDAALADDTVTRKVTVNDESTGLPVGLLGNIAPNGNRAGAMILWGDNASNAGAWSVGIDTAAPTPYRDLFFAKVLNTSVNDLVYLYHNGTGAPTMGFGWVNADPAARPNARVMISSEDDDPTMSALALRHSTTMTSGNPLEFVDSASGRPRTWYDSSGRWNRITIRSERGDYPRPNLAMVDNGGGTVYQWRHDSDGSLSLYYASGGSYVTRHTGSRTVSFHTTQMGFFSAAQRPRPRPTGSRRGNSALTSLLSALASLGLVVDSTT